MSRHSMGNHTGMYVFFFMSAFILGAIFPLFWLWFLPQNSVAFNTLANKSGIKPFDSLMLMEFLVWPVVMSIFLRGTMR
jgi:hypothetical protein